MVNNLQETNRLEYSKELHWVDSPSVFWDMDAVIYIAILSLLIWGIVRLVQKKKGSEKIRFIDYCAKYLYTAYLPLFILFAVPLLMSGQYYILSNIIISLLPLVYGVILQLLFILIRKMRAKNELKRNG